MSDIQTGKSGQSDAAPAGRETDAPAFSNATQLGLLGIGIVLLLLPVIIAVAAPAVLLSAQFYLRIAAALGGALIGGFIPGVLQITLPWVKAPARWACSSSFMPSIRLPSAWRQPIRRVPWQRHPVPPASTGNQLKKWIAPAAAMARRRRSIQRTFKRCSMDEQDDAFKNIPIAVFISSDNPTIAKARMAAIKDLKVPKPQVTASLVARFGRP